MIKAKVSIFWTLNSESHASHDNKDIILFLGSVTFPMSVISTKLYFVEIGWVRQKLYIFKCTMLKTLNSDFLDWEDTLIGKHLIYPPFAISLMHFSDKSESYHVNDWYNFEAIDRSFSQGSNFLFQKQISNLLKTNVQFSVQTFDFSTLYTLIPHDLLKSRISNLVHNAFRKKDGTVRYTHIKVTRAKGYFTHDINGGGDNMYTADNICKMIEFSIDNIFVQFGGRLFRQEIGIPMGTNCAPLLADLFLYSYENEFLDNMIRSGHRRLARSFNLCYRYIDDLIVFNNKTFLDYLKEIYPSQLTVEKANKSDHLTDYLDLTFIIDSGGKLSTRLYDKRDDFDFHIVNFPYLSSNIPSGPSYGVYISQLIRYARCCSHYDDFRYHHKCLVDRLLPQGYIALRLEKSFKKFYGRYQDLIEKYQRSVNVMVNDSFPG